MRKIPQTLKKHPKYTQYMLNTLNIPQYLNKS